MDIAKIVISEMSGESGEKLEKSPMQMKMDEQALIASDIITAIKKADARMLAHALAAFDECCKIEVEDERYED